MRISLWLHGIAFTASVALFVWLLSPAHQAALGAVFTRVVFDVTGAIGRPLIRVVMIAADLLNRWILTPALERAIHAVL